VQLHQVTHRGEPRQHRRARVGRLVAQEHGAKSPPGLLAGGRELVAVGLAHDHHPAPASLHLRRQTLGDHAVVHAPRDVHADRADPSGGVDLLAAGLLESFEHRVDQLVTRRRGVLDRDRVLTDSMRSASTNSAASAPPSPAGSLGGMVCASGRMAHT
jgi:hypothetical protein